MNESDIQDFWNRNPCGDDLLVGGLQERHGDYESFFSDYDSFRYRKEAHILRCLDNIDFKSKHVLEIGLGQGADSEQIIKRGAIWSGLDLTPESVARVQTRLSLRQLPHQSVKQGSVLQIPYEYTGPGFLGHGFPVICEPRRKSDGAWKATRSTWCEPEVERTS